jgi:hypothetical protein
VTISELRVVAALSLASTGVVLANGASEDSNAAVRRALIAAAATMQASAPVHAAAATGPEHATPPVTPAPTPAATPVSDPAAAPVAVAAAPDPAPAKQPARKPAATPEAPKPSKVGHVFVIALTGPGVDATFGDTSPATYLARDLRAQGALLDNYVPLGNADLPNYIALTSGQPPNADTRAECATYEDFPSSSKQAKSGVLSGDGCVYPNTVLSLGDQITSSGRSWRAYAEDMDKGEAGADVTCRRPDLPGADDTLTGRPQDSYATRHNPFAYFHSLLDLGDCIANDVALPALDTDLKAERTTPNLAFIAPNLCHGGTESPCADGTPGGLPATDAFLHEWVPKILASKAYKSDGLLIVAFLSGTAPADPAAAPPRTGLLLVSKWAEPGGRFYSAYDPYSVLRSIEDLFALKPLAKAAGAASFAKTVLPKAF